MDNSKKVFLFSLTKAKEKIAKNLNDNSSVKNNQNLDNIFNINNSNINKNIENNPFKNVLNVDNKANQNIWDLTQTKSVSESLKIIQEVKKQQAEKCSNNSIETKDTPETEGKTDEICSEEIQFGLNFMEELNEKYNLNIDFSQDLTDEQMQLLQQAYVIDEQQKNLEAAKANMLEYFDTLGILDSAYDGIKDLFGAGLTKGDIEKYYEDEKQKLEILTSILQNGGSLTLDDNTRALLTRLMGDEGAAAAADIDLLHADSLSFEEAYKILKGVEYNPDAISTVMASKDAYSLVASEQQSAVALEQAMMNSSPAEILDYFNKIAQNQEGVTGEELFNQYYKTFFENYPEEMAFKDFNGLGCKGIEVKDGYLWQELEFPEEYDEKTIEMLCQTEFLYKEIDENGNAHYYRVASLEDKNHVKSNAYGEDDEYDITGLMGIDTYEYIQRANNEISKNNLYLDKTKKEYDEEFGEGAFDKILEEYPKMYEEAFGKNELVDKLTEYRHDMDSYSRTLSMVLSVGCFAASFIPGVNIASWIPLAAAGIDNAIDLVNLATNKKDGEFGQWALNTLIEAGMFAIGMGINRFAHNMGNRFVADKIAKGSTFIMKHARGVEALVEYGIDNALSVVWDTARGIVDGSLINEDGSFNWDYYGKMIASDLIFNSADLRNGMAFYKSIASDGIDLGDGVKFKIDSKTGSVKFIYENGMEFEINKYMETATIYSDASHETGIGVVFNKETKCWETFDGEKIDILSADSVGKLAGSNWDISDEPENIDIDPEGPKDTLKDISEDERYQGRTKEIVDEMLKNDSVKDAVDSGLLDKYNIFDLADAGSDAINKAIQLLDNEEIIKFRNKDLITGSEIVKFAKDVNFDKILELIETPRISWLIERGNMSLLDVLEVSDCGVDALNNLNKMINESDKMFTTAEKYFSAGDGEILQLATNEQIIELSKTNPQLYQEIIDLFANPKTTLLVFDKNVISVSDMLDNVLRDPDLINVIKKANYSDIEALSKLKSEECLSSIDKSLYDLANIIFHGTRIDSSLDDYSMTINGRKVGIEFDNDAVSQEYLKNHPEFQISSGKVITEDMMKAIEQALINLEKSGQKLPDKIYLTDLFGPSKKLNGKFAAGEFNQKNSNSIFINTDTIDDLDYLRYTIEHEVAHMLDYDKDLSIFGSDCHDIKISEDFKYKGLTNKDIERLVGSYALTDNQEFVAEVSVMLAEGIIVYNKSTGKYEIQSDSYTNPRSKKVKMKKGDQEKINILMELYNKMTSGMVLKAKEI